MMRVTPATSEEVKVSLLSHVQTNRKPYTVEKKKKGWTWVSQGHIIARNDSGLREEKREGEIFLSRHGVPLGEKELEGIDEVGIGRRLIPY